jgi:hypothetical protein
MTDPTNQEIENAAFQLAGLIYGISLDGIITNTEYEALKSWCRENEPLCELESFQRLHRQIKPIIDDGIVNSEEIEELKQILNDFLELNSAKNEEKSNLYFLNGIFKGILASGGVNTYEIYKLNQWLEKNELLKNSAPFDEMFSLIASVLEDKKVDDDEAEQLKAFFANLIK